MSVRETSSQRTEQRLRGKGQEDDTEEGTYKLHIYVYIYIERERVQKKIKGDSKCK